MENKTNEQRKNVKTKLKLCTINIDGMSFKSQFALNKFIHDEDIDVLFMSESRSTDKEKLELNNMSYICDTNKSVNSGTVLYVNNSYSLTKLDEISKLSQHIDSCWGLLVVNKQRFIVGSVYAKFSYKSSIKEIMKMLKAAENKKSELKACGIILSGDFNARHPSWGDKSTNENGKQIVELLDYTKYSISISETPTFLCVDGGSSFIDFSIISNDIADSVDCCKTDVGVELHSGAPKRGHVPLITEILTKNSITKQSYTTKLDMTKMNWDNWTQSIENDIEDINESMSKESNPFTLWNRLNSIITKATNDHGKMKKSSLHSKPYWTESLTIVLRKLQLARKCYIKRNTPTNLQKLDEARDEFDLERKKACQDFLLNKVKKLNSAQAQQFWKEFNKIFKKRSIQKIDPLEDENKTILTENKDIEKSLFSVFFEAKHLAEGDFDENFYREVNKIHEEIIKENTREDPHSVTKEDIKHLNRNISLDEITKAIKCTAKSVDNNNFHPSMLRHLGPNAKNVLMKLFNLCLTTNQWIWDAAEVIFLRKAGKDSYAKPGSYRPICITAYIGKLLEAIIAIRIELLLLKLGHEDSDQEGFSKSKNTIRYLNRLNLGIKVDKENCLTVICIFIDFEKAFDSVWKQGVIMKLHKLGIQGNILKLVNSFLFTRKVALNINGEVGPSRQCSEYGLPQGSVLSPALFKIYISDFVEELNSHPDIALYKFADDGTIKIAAKNSNTCLKTLNQVLKSLQNWTKKWRMKLNCDKNKTEIVAFNTAEGNKNIIPEQFMLGDKVIFRVEKTKVLGLTIDEDLSYIPHSEEVLKGLHQVWATLCKYSSRHWGFTQKVMLQLVKTLFISKLSYASHIWMTSSNTKNIIQLWYHIIKSIIGAVLNIKHNIAEIILGVPPILIQAKINEVKHFLKLNISPVPNDRYAEFLTIKINDPNTASITLENKLKDTFKFLKWKLLSHKNHFTIEDKIIIDGNHYGQFFKLSSKACSYTQNMTNQYLEKELWKPMIKTQFQIEGYATFPEPHCATLPIPPNTARENEVLLMSLFYKNNIMNGSLYKIGKVPSPLCSLCNQEEETAEQSSNAVLSIKISIKRQINNTDWRVTWMIKQTFNQTLLIF